jgi:hypothetical protein
MVGPGHAPQAVRRQAYANFQWAWTVGSRAAFGRYCCKSRRGAASAQQSNRNEQIFESSVTGSVDFHKKINLVRTSASQQLGEERDKQFAEDTCKGVLEINTKRQDVIHASFEPAGGGVQFRRTVARDGRVRVLDPVWNDTDFEEQRKKMEALEAALNRLILMIKPLPPMGWSTPFQDIYYPHRSSARAAALGLTSGAVEDLPPLKK